MWSDFDFDYRFEVLFGSFLIQGWQQYDGYCSRNSQKSNDAYI